MGEHDRPKLAAREILELVWVSYGFLIPRVFLFSLVFLLITWFVTEVLF